MPDWNRIRSDVAAHLRAARDVVGARIGGDAPYAIAPYHGYGTRDRWLVQGRALRAAPLAPARAEDSAWRNLASMYQRLESDPLPGAEVRIEAAGVSRVAAADEEGFFRAWITPGQVSDAPWHDVQLELAAPRRDGTAEPRARARVRVPGPQSRFVLVSDVDDTVLQSHITSLVQAVRTVILSNARTRLPFPGVSAFYRALARGASGGEENPVFYLSSSPWNLFDLLAEFLEVQRLPAGPLLLRDWDVSLGALAGSSLQSFKAAHLRELLALYPALPFILVGDTSQQDPEIYSRIVHDHPGRVLAVYIRDVTRSVVRGEAVRRLAAELEAARVPLVLAEDTLSAARHAAERGWIDPGALREIAEDAQKDEGIRPGKEPV